jgi:hypothetical protein
MKKIVLLLLILSATSVFSQSKDNPLVILDTKKLGFMRDIPNEMEAIKSDDISTITVFKDSVISKKYGSDYGVIVITSKKYILETFYKDFIQNSPLKENIKSTEVLADIGIIGVDLKEKNQPYNELYKYIYTNTASQKILKIAEIIFINPEDAIKISPKWINGALEISAEVE